MEYGFYRKVTAAMVSLYLFVTVIVSWKPLVNLEAYSFDLALLPKVALTLLLVIAGAVGMNYILKSVPATVALIALLCVVSWVSALTLVVMLAVIGWLIRPTASHSESVSGASEENEDWSSSTFSAIPTDLSTGFPIGTLGSHFPK